MNTLESRAEGFQYERRVLQDVSRSFALTIPQLPVKLQYPITNAYLIYRIIDTIEDEKNLSQRQKFLFFREFVDVLNGRASARGLARAVEPCLNGSSTSAERDLIRQMPIIIDDFFVFSPKQQEAVRRCAGVMVEGMFRFQEIQNSYGLGSMQDLEQYCYHVAGVVGEMLTELFCDYSPEIARNRKRLLELGLSFGLGLQMTNIVKDLWDDNKRNVCWIPRSLFAMRDPDRIKAMPDRNSEAFRRGIQNVITSAVAFLGDAMQYTILIPRSETGIRKFCLWAIGMAVFPLRNISHNLHYESGLDVKISHQTLKSIILVSNAAVRNNSILEMLFTFFSDEILPPSERSGFGRARITMKKISPVLLTVLFVTALFQLSHAAAEGPTDFVRTMLDKVMSIQNAPELRGTAHRDERRTDIKKVIAQNFAFDTMSKNALGGYWRNLTPSEQKEFSGIFQDLFQDSYTKLVLDFLKREKIVYSREKQESNSALVQTTIVRANENIAVDYSLLPKSGSWLVQDVSIDGVSIIKNYQKSFTRVIERESFNSLLKKMHLQQQAIGKSSGKQMLPK
jgi:farnesyl-diphosphate farnesyltransferase